MVLNFLIDLALQNVMPRINIGLTGGDTDSGASRSGKSVVDDTRSASSSIRGRLFDGIMGVRGVRVPRLGRLPTTGDAGREALDAGMKKSELGNELRCMYADGRTGDVGDEMLCGTDVTECDRARRYGEAGLLATLYGNGIACCGSTGRGGNAEPQPSSNGVTSGEDEPERACLDPRRGGGGGTPRPKPGKLAAVDLLLTMRPACSLTRSVATYMARLR